MYMFLKYRAPHSAAAVVLLVYVHPETLEFYFKMREVLNAVGLLGMNTWMAAKSHLPPDMRPCILSDIKCPCDPRLVWNNRTRFLNMETVCVLLESLVRRSRGCRAGARHFQDWFVKHIVLGEGYMRSTDGTPMSRVIENQFRWKRAAEDMVYVVEVSDEGTTSLQEFGSELRAQHRHLHDVENVRPVDRSHYVQDPVEPPVNMPPSPPPSPPVSRPPVPAGPPSPPVSRPPVPARPPVRSHVGPVNMPMAPVRLVPLPVGPRPMEPTPVSPEETTDAVYHLMEAAGTGTVLDMTFTAQMLKVEIVNNRLHITVTDVDNFVV